MTSRRRGVGSFFLGLFVGIIVVVGALGGVVLWAMYGLNIKTIEGWIGQDIVKDEELEKKSIMDLYAWGSEFVGDEKNLTVKRFNEILAFQIPLVYGKLDLTSIEEIPVTKLGENIDLILDKVTLEVIEGFGLTLPNIPILVNNKAQPVIKFFTIVMDSVTGDDVSLGSLSTDFGLTLPMHPVLEKMKNVPINQLESQMNTLILDLTIGEVIGAGQTGLLGVLENTKIGELEAKVQTLSLGQVMDVGTSGLLFELKDTPINELESAIKTLKLSSVVTIDETSPKILQSLSNSTMDSLGEDINNLKINQVLTGTGGNTLADKLLQEPRGSMAFINMEAAVNDLIATLTVKELAECVGTTLTSSSPLYDLTLSEFLVEMDKILAALPPMP